MGVNLKALELAMVSLDEATAMEQAGRALNDGVSPVDIINTLASAMRQIGDRFARGEAFIPELVMSGQIFDHLTARLMPDVDTIGAAAHKGTVLLGTVRGDLHDLGVNLVGLILSSAGFKIINLGKDVPVETFVRHVRERKPEVLGLSALLTTTMNEQKLVIESLEKEGLRENTRVMIGGAPVTQEWADAIGADAVGFDAVDAMEKALALVG
jgi:trimethylamine corrinoid protein